MPERIQLTGAPPPPQLPKGVLHAVYNFKWELIVCHVYQMQIMWY